MKSYRRIKGFQRGIEILRYLANQGEPVSGPDIAESMRMPYSTVMCHLATAEDEGLVRATGDCWEIGIGMSIFWFKVREQEEARRDEAERNLKAMGAV